MDTFAINILTGLILKSKKNILHPGTDKKYYLCISLLLDTKKRLQNNENKSDKICRLTTQELKEKFSAAVTHLIDAPELQSNLNLSQNLETLANPFISSNPPLYVINSFINGIIEGIKCEDAQDRRKRSDEPVELTSNYIETLVNYYVQTRHAITWQERMLYFFDKVDCLDITNPNRKSLWTFYRILREFQARARPLHFKQLQDLIHEHVSMLPGGTKKGYLWKSSYQGPMSVKCFHVVERRSTDYFIFENHQPFQESQEQSQPTVSVASIKSNSNESVTDEIASDGYESERSDSSVSLIITSSSNPQNINTSRKKAKFNILESDQSSSDFYQ